MLLCGLINLGDFKTFLIEGLTLAINFFLSPPDSVKF